MDIGMLWYDDDAKRPFGEKVARAVDYYKAKYGSVPTVCFVNPATLKQAGVAGHDSAAGVQIRSARNVMVDHFWLGVGESGGNGHAPAKANGARKPARALRTGVAAAAGRAG